RAPGQSSVMFETDGVDEDAFRTRKGSQRVAFFVFDFVGGMGSQETVDHLVLLSVSDKASSLAVGESLYTFQLRQQILTKYQPQLFDAAFFVEFQPGLVRNLNALIGIYVFRAIVGCRRRKHDDILRNGSGVRWSFVQDVQIT